MAPITPWLASLIENELENVIAWKSIVKPDPDADGEQRSRFSDDGSNLRSIVGSPPLDSDSTIQLLEKPGPNARAKIPISDGEVSVLAILSDAAWDAYDKGLEEGEEPRKGDLLLCKKLTVVSTTYGPSEERIKLRLEDLELTGNFRKVIGQPSPLLERPSIIASRKQIEDLRLKQLQGEGPAEDDQENLLTPKIEEVEDEYEEEAEGGASDDDQTVTSTVGVSANTANALHDPAPADVALPEKPSNEVSRMSPPNRTSPATHNSVSTRLESQLPLDVTPSQAIPQPRNPVRRTRGGFSIGREGFETTRGDNLTGPQAPTLHTRQARHSVSPPKAKLLDVFSKLPGQVPKKRSPEPSAPVSAQVVNEDIIVETPTKVKRGSAATTTHESTPIPRKRYRIPRDQKALLEHPSSWIPSAPGHQFPHPNVPIGLLTAWNSKATGATKQPSQSSPIPEIEQSSEVKSLEVVQTEPQATAAAELEDESDESEDSDTSHDERIEWSPSPSRNQALPPDSSAAHISPRVSRPGSRDTAVSGSERMPISIADDGPSSSSAGDKSIAGTSERYRELPQWKQAAAPQALAINDRVSSTPVVHRAPSSNHSVHEQLPRAPHTTQKPTGVNLIPISERVDVPSSSLRSPALPVASQSPATPLGLSGSRDGGAMSRPVANYDRRQLPRASQPMSAGMKRPADNYYGPTRPSTQQTPNHRRRTFDQKDHVLSSTSSATPLGPPTGPRTFTGHQSSTYDRRNPNAIPLEGPGGLSSSRGSRHSVSDRRSNGSIPDRERVPSGDSYRPSQSERRGDRTLSRNNSTDRRRPGGSQTPNSTNEMELGVPRALPPSNYRQDRSRFYRDVQQRHWLGLHLPTDNSVGVSVPLLLRSYRDKYTADPVTEQEFGKLVDEMRSKANGVESKPTTPTTTTENAHANPQDRPVAKHVSSMNTNNEHEAMDERDGSRNPLPTNIFTEFLNGWRNLRPNGPVSNDAAGTRPRRKLDVLSWGFGE